jgi:hypothetical protein
VRQQQQLNSTSNCVWQRFNRFVQVDAERVLDEVAKLRAATEAAIADRNRQRMRSNEKRL